MHFLLHFLLAFLLVFLPAFLFDWQRLIRPGCRLRSGIFLVCKDDLHQADRKDAKQKKGYNQHTFDQSVPDVSFPVILFFLLFILSFSQVSAVLLFKIVTD